MISRWVRTWYGVLLRPLLALLAQLGVTPDALTVGSLLLVTLAGLLFALGQIGPGVGVLLLGTCLDGIDGALAQFSGSASARGAFLDSVCDHCGDFAVYAGLLWLSLKSDARLNVLLLFVALFGSVFGSHVRAYARQLEIDTKATGLFTRFERMSVLMIGLLLGRVTIALWILAIFNCFSALQRVIQVLWVSRVPVRTESALSGRPISGAGKIAPDPIHKNKSR